MFFKYFKLECALYGSGVNQTKITIKNALHGDNFVTKDNHKSNKWSSTQYPHACTRSPWQHKRMHKRMHAQGVRVGV